MPARTRRQLQLTVALTVTTLLTVVAASGPALAAPDGCTELVTYSRDGARGDEGAVALTSQSLDAGVAGWGHVSWQAAPATTVAGVVVTGPTGTTVLTEGDLSTGTVEDVVAITFCGPAAAEAADETTSAGTSATTGGTSGGVAVGDSDTGGTATAGAATGTDAAGAPAASVSVAAVAMNATAKTAVAGADVDTGLAVVRPAPVGGEVLVRPGGGHDAAASAAPVAAEPTRAPLAAALARHQTNLALGALIGLLGGAGALLLLGRRARPSRPRHLTVGDLTVGARR